MNNRKDRRPSWILPYSKRNKVCRKLANTMDAIKESRSKGDWDKVTKLSRLIRHVWWGIKRYKNV